MPLKRRKKKEVREKPNSIGGQWRFQAWWPMEGSKLGDQWKVPSWVANGRFQAWWPMEGSKLGGQ